MAELATKFIEAQAGNGAGLYIRPNTAAERAAFHQLARDVKDAKKVKLDDNFISVATIASVQEPAILYRKMPRLRLPFETMWIEWPEKLRLDTLDDIGYMPERAVDEALLCGVLLSRVGGLQNGSNTLFRMQVMFESPNLGFGPEDGTSIGIASMHILFNPLVPISDHVEYANLYDQQYIRRTSIPDIAFAGPYLRLYEHERPIIDHMSDHIMIMAAGPFRDRVLRAIHGKRTENEAYTVAFNMAAQLGGDFRFIFSVLALWNTVQVVQGEPWDSEYAVRRKSDGKKLRDYLQYVTATIPLPKDRVIKSFRKQPKAEMGSRAFSGVPGFWCQTRRGDRLGRDPRCQRHDHHWEIDGERLKCTRDGCRAKNWFLHDFGRGDAGKGVIVKEWMLTSNDPVLRAMAKRATEVK